MCADGSEAGEAGTTAEAEEQEQPWKYNPRYLIGPFSPTSSCPKSDVRKKVRRLKTVFVSYLSISKFNLSFITRFIHFLMLH